jgi:hypothetical protein
MHTERAIPASARNFTIALGLLVVAPLALTLLGCETRSRYPTAHLAGTVSIGGERVAEGKLVLLPLDPAHGPSVGADIASGHYDCPRAPAGHVRVQVYANRPTGRVLTVMGAELPEVVSLVPESARDGLKIEVTGDNLRQDISLPLVADE